LNYTVLFHPLARADLRASTGWYEERLSGLGLRFAEAVGQQAKLLETSPQKYRTVSLEVRRCAVAGFPYELFFQILDVVVLIVAVRGKRQDPDTLIERLELV
jgi:hypothetical protein